ncbi:hypothetical protein RXV94_13800, partial [Yeosuana sp. MJ-SS3]|nr:hypothetical protein [Yeosuana sp. MJ-SS3]
MKNNYLLSVFLFFLSLASNTIYAQNESGIYESYAILNSNGGGNIYFDLQAATANTDFDGANLGTFTPSGTLILNGAQNKTYKCGADNILNGWLYYRIYEQSSVPPGFISTPIFFNSDIGNGNHGGCISALQQIWESSGAGIDVLNGLGSGDYYLEVYTTADFDFTNDDIFDGTHYANNDPDGGGPTSPNNYKAVFRVDNPPTAACQNIIVQLDGSGNATISAADIDNGSTDDFDDPPNLSIDINSFSCLNVGSLVTVTLTATDSLGQTDTCMAQVTVEDNVNPTITCLGNQTRSADPGQCYYTVSGTEFDPISYNDNCSVASIVNDFNGLSTLAGAQIPDGTPIEWTVTDTSGNYVGCIRMVTVTDNEAPVANCPTPNASYNADAGQCDATLS